MSAQNRHQPQFGGAISSGANRGHDLGAFRFCEHIGHKSSLPAPSPAGQRRLVTDLLPGPHLPLPTQRAGRGGNRSWVQSAKPRLGEFSPRPLLCMGRGREPALPKQRRPYRSFCPQYFCHSASRGISCEAVVQVPSLSPSLDCPQASRRPIAVNDPALDIGRGERSPIPAVEAVAGVIAADEVSARRYRHHLVARDQVSRLGVDRIMNLPDRIAQGGGLAVHEKPVSENPQFIARFAHNPLHIVFPWRHSMADPVGLEDNDVTAPRMPCSRADALHPHMIAFHDGWRHPAGGHIEWPDELQ